MEIQSRDPFNWPTQKGVAHEKRCDCTIGGWCRDSGGKTVVRIYNLRTKKYYWGSVGSTIDRYSIEAIVGDQVTLQDNISHKKYTLTCTIS